jgi:hypothetical protein
MAQHPTPVEGRVATFSCPLLWLLALKILETRINVHPTAVSEKLALFRIVHVWRGVCQFLGIKNDQVIFEPLRTAQKR